MTLQYTRISVNGVALNVGVGGPADGPAVLLIHGFPDDHQVWRHQWPALIAAGYRVIAPDLRGFGDSDMPAPVRAYRVQALLADLIGVLDALGVAQARVVGHDWGAAIGWQLAIHHPQRVERYAALSVGHPSAYARAGWRQKLKGWYTLMFQLRGLTEALLKAGDWAFMRAFTQEPVEAPRWIARLSRPGRLTAALNIYRANVRMVLPADYPPVRVPVLGVWSSGDRFLSQDQMTDSAAYMAAPWRYEQIDGVSHWMTVNAVDRVNALLLDYLR